MDLALSNNSLRVLLDGRSQLLAHDLVLNLVLHFVEGRGARRDHVGHHGENDLVALQSHRLRTPRPSSDQ